MPISANCPYINQIVKEIKHICNNLFLVKMLIFSLIWSYLDIISHIF